MAFAGIFFPTRNAILPDIVGLRELGAANALSSATWSTMLAFGAALGGIVAGQWGLQPAFVIDSLTFVLSAVILSRVVYKKIDLPDPSPTKSSLNIFSQYAEGLRYLKGQRNVLMMVLQKTFQALGVSSAFQIIQVTLASEIYVIGEGGGTSMGIFFAVVGVGTGIGPIVARVFTGDDERKLRYAIAWSYLICAVGLATIATLGSFPLVLFGTFLRGLGVALGWVFSTQLLLQMVPNRVRGRVFSTEYALLTLANAVGAALGGWAFDNFAITIPQMLWIMAVLTVVLGVVSVLGGILRVEKNAIGN